MKAIYKRELKSYFRGFTGFLFTTFLLFLVGIYSMAMNFNQGYPQFEYVLGNVSFIYMIIVPVLTMRAVAEERRQKTDQLLYSLPTTTGKVVLGKYLSMVTVLFLPVLVICLYPLILSFYGSVNFAASYGAIFGYFMMGAALIAVGLFISSLTENVVISAVVCFAVMLVSYLMGDLSSFVPTTAAASLAAFVVVVLLAALLVWYLTKNTTVGVLVAVAGVGGLTLLYFLAPAALEGSFQHVMTALSLFDRFDNFLYGIFDLTSVVYYLTAVGVFLFLTVQSMEKRRWS